MDAVTSQNSRVDSLDMSDNSGSSSSNVALGDDSSIAKASELTEIPATRVEAVSGVVVDGVGTDASDDGGYVSGEEVFKTASDRLPAESSYDDNLSGNSEIVVSGGEAFVDTEEAEAKSGSEVINGVHGDDGMIAAVDVVERDGVKVTSEGDSVVENVHVDIAAPGVVVVGDSHELDRDLVLDNTDEIPLDNGFDKLEDGLSGVSEKSEKMAVLTEPNSNGVAKNGSDAVMEAEDEGTLDEGVSLAGTEIVETQKKLEDDGASHIVVDSISDSKKDIDEDDAKNIANGDEIDDKDKPSATVSEGASGENGLMEDGETEEIVFENEDAAKQFLEQLERGDASVADDSERIDGQIVTDSEEDAETDDEEGESKELFDSAALAALLKAATGADQDDGTISITSQDGSRLFSVERPAGLGSSLRSLKPSARPNRPTLFSSSALTGAGGTSETNISEEEKKKLENLQQLRVKFLRLIRRLGHSPEEATTSQVLYRLALIAGRQTNQIFNLDAAKATALHLEEEGKEDLDFSLNILVLGKTGVGKSATINSIFGQSKSEIHAYEPATSHVKELTGVVDGVKIRVIDTPGLKPSGSEQGMNTKVLSSVKSLLKKFPLDIILYVDRLDTQTRDLNDMPLLKTITNVLGSSVWRSAIVALTHAATAPPDGPSGNPLSYEAFVAQRSHVVQQCIGQACGDLRLMNPSSMNPVALVENHASCRKNRDGQKVLPNGQTWRSQLLLLCYSVKILSEASSLSRPQDPFDHKKLFGFRVRSPPLPYLLSWLLQSRAHPKGPSDQGGDVDSDIDPADLSDSDAEVEDDEYEQLPPFKPLKRKQLEKLTKEQKKAYFDEYDYRVKLLQKKQWKEELRRIKEMKRKGKLPTEENGDDADPAPAAIPVPLPDMVLPPSFDSDNPGYRYRFLEPNSQFLARPVLDSHGWDHDCGYDGVNVEHGVSVIDRFPATIAVQVTKDKKEFNLHMDSSIAAKHNENASTMAGFDIQNIGKQLAYIVRGETKIKNMRRNKTGAGVSVTFLGKSVATGVKVEDQISLGKRWTLVGSTGTVRSKGDAAYGANVEIRLKDGDFPVVQDQSSLGLSLVKWRGDLALGANLQSQVSVGRSTKVAVRAGLNNKMSGQLTVKTSSSEQLQIALIGVFPVLMAIYKTFRPGAADNFQIY